MPSIFLNPELGPSFPEDSTLISRYEQTRNIGIGSVKGGFIVIMSPDTLLATDWLEDKDLGWRASMMRWQSIDVQSSKILHKWSSTLGQSPSKFYLLERLLSITKNYFEADASTSHAGVTHSRIMGTLVCRGRGLATGKAPKLRGSLSCPKPFVAETTNRPET